MSPPRRVGSETSETRDLLLDCVERLLLDQGYAAVTYRALAAEAGVTPGLVQYYFPKLDDLFVASIRRYTERNVLHLVAALEARADEPRRVLWEYSRDESGAALMMEYMALGNHRRSIRSEIAKVTRQVQQIQLDALGKALSERADAERDEVPAPALLFLLTGIPKLIQIYSGFRVRTGHQEVIELVERYLDETEPRGERKPAPSRTGSR